MEISVKSVHESLLKNPNQAFFQTIEGEVLTLERFMRASKPIWTIHVYPGSFNPLHEAHKAIYDRMGKHESIRCFEMSINRFDKEPMAVDDLERRLKQFRGYAPVMITNVAKFIEKAGLLAMELPTYFHVGTDTLARLLKHHSRMEVQGMKCQFVYYDRVVDGQKVMELPNVLPINCRKGKTLTEEEMKVSSTAIRNNQTTQISP